MQIKRIILLLCLLGLNLKIVAQSPREHRHQQQGKHRQASLEKMQQEKKDFLIKDLELSPEEVQSLIPILQERDKSRFEIWRTEQELREKIKREDKLASEEDIRNLLELQSNNRIKIAELEHSYYKRIASILSPRKHLQLERANRSFIKQHSRRHN